MLWRRLEEALSGVEGVREASVSLTPQRAWLTVDGGAALPAAEALRAAAALADVRVLSTAEEEQEEEDDRGWQKELGRERRDAAEARTRLAVSAVLSAPLLAAHAGAVDLERLLSLTHGQSAWLQLALATPVVAYAGRDIFASALRMARQGGANMDTLVSVGVLSAFGYSAAQTLLGAHGAPLYFETAGVVTTVILAGRWMESRAKASAAGGLRALLGLRPRVAHLSLDGEAGTLWREVPARAVSPGDLVVVRPGEQVPADGTVARGAAAADESMLTGESVPVPKRPGDAVAGGSVLSGAAPVVVRAERVGADTALAAILRVVERSQAGKPRFQRLADRVAGRFVPVVCSVAAAAVAHALHWQGLEMHDAMVRGMAVLVTACPCALGLAAPTAVQVATARAAAEGVLVRSPESLERAGAVRALVVDKTGTLTEGRPRVRSVRAAAGGPSRRRVLELAGALALQGSHPFDAGVVRRCRADGVEPPALVPDTISYSVGRGLAARLAEEGGQEGGEVLLGSARFLEERGVAGAADALGSAELYVAARGRAVGALSLDDPVREGAAAAVAELHRRGVEVWVASGDRPEVAAAVARRLGIPDGRARGGVTPQGKVDLVRELRERGLVVGCVGDGVNDAPALSAADVSFAVSTGSDVAVQRADLVLLNGDVGKLVNALRLSDDTLRVIRQNLAFAFAYNVLAVPLAAAGIVSPVTGSTLMAFESVTVVGNSLRLRAM